MKQHETERGEFYPNRIALLKDGWAVRFNGEIQRPRWQDEGAALAFLAALTKGTRKPEPETTP